MALEASINGQKPKKKGQTLRFELELAPPNDDSTNEFSYAHLTDDARTKLEKRDLQPVAGPIQEESDVHLEALARKFEEKYGPKSTKKRKILEQDLVDRGSGYDVSDSFIDDRELYEDFVPPHVDTQFGGFYINTGQLEFKQSWDIHNDDSDFVTKKKRKPKIKKQPSHCTPQAILASQKLKKAKQHVASHKAPKKALFATSGSSPLVKQAKPVAKRPKKETLIQTSSLLGASLLSQSSSSVSNMSTTPSVPISVGGISLSVPLFNASGPSTTEQSSLSSQVQAAVQKLSVSSEISQHPPEEPVTKPPPVLPGTLPPDLQARIQRLEMLVAKDQTADGKVSIKAKGGHDELLADIEVACKVVTLKTRTAVMEYLSPKLGVSKPTLFKRTKQTLRKREEEALKQPLQNLKEAIEATMPEQLVHYEELKARIESTSSLSDKEKMEVDEDIKMEDVFEDSQLVPSSSQQEANKTKRAPRKKYQWSDETKRLVCDVVRVKVETETIINRISRGNPEDLLMQFLEAKVKPLWPKGWMQRSVLYKVSEPAHTHFTSPLPRKPVAVKKEKPTKPLVAVVQGATTLPNISPALSQLIQTESQVKSVQVTAPGKITAAHNRPVETVGKSIQLKQAILKTPVPSSSARGCTQKLGNQQPKTILRTSSPSSTSNLALMLPHSQVLLPQPSTAQQTTPKKSNTQSVSVQSCSVPITRYISTQAASSQAKLYSSTAQTSPVQTTKRVPPIRIQTVQQQPHSQGMPTAKLPPQQVTPRPVVSFYSHGQHTITRVSSPPQQVSTRVSPPSASSQQASPSTMQLVTNRPTQHASSSTQHGVSSPTQHAISSTQHAISSTQHGVSSPTQHAISSTQHATTRVPSPTQLATTRVPPPMQLATARVPSPTQLATTSVPSPTQHATVGVSFPTQLATTRVPSPTQLATTRVPPPMQLATARVPSPTQLATARVPSPTQHATVGVSFPTQLATARVPSSQFAAARVPSPMQLATARVPSPMQFATTSVPSPTQHATVGVSFPTQLATTRVPSPTQLATARVPSPMQLATARVPSPMQLATARVPSPMQLATARVPSPMQLATARVPSPMQLATASVPSPMQLATTSLPNQRTISSTQHATTGVPSPTQHHAISSTQLATARVSSSMQFATSRTQHAISPMHLATSTQVQLATPGVPSPMQLASYPPLQYSVDKISAQQPITNLATAQVPPPVLQQSAAAITQVTRVPSPLTLHKTTPPRTLSHFGTQNQPTIKSPVDQIFEEHSYGSQQSPTASVVPVLPDREALSSALLMLAEQSGSTHLGNATNSGSHGGANSGSTVPTTAPFNNYQ